VADDAPGALFSQGAGALLQDELVRLHDLAEAGDESATKIMDWVMQAQSAGEILHTVPDEAADLVELLGEIGKTAECFVLARAAAFILNHGEIPTHLRFRVTADFERI
jgi:hypothetical protein